jgi:hypothetical protein
MFRPKRTALAILTVCAAAVLAPMSAGATGGKPSYGCGQGFDLGALTYDEYLLLPGTQAALDQGLASEEGIRAGLMHVDHNQNGVVCAQSVPGWQISNKPFARYLYNVVDDNASTGGR